MFLDVLAAPIGEKENIDARRYSSLAAIFGALATVGAAFASFFAHEAAAEGC